MSAHLADPPTTPTVPPVTALGMTALGLIVAGGIYLASNLPHHVSLTPAVILLALAGAVTVTNAALLSRVPGFAWKTFFMVAGRATAAYIIVTGMIEYVFVYDHTRGAVLGVLTGMLAIFALNPPLIMAFTVARYQRPD